VTYNARDYRLDNPLLQESNQAVHFVDGFCFGSWVYTDWSDDGVLHYAARLNATAGVNNRINILKAGDDKIQIKVYDSAGGDLAAEFLVTTTNWTAGGWKYIEACTSNTGAVVGRHYNATNSTWYLWSGVGAGTGIQDGNATFWYVGGPTPHWDGYFKNFIFGPYNAIWPMYGWSGGPPTAPVY
jgi:hypothetical protein